MATLPQAETADELLEQLLSVGPSHVAILASEAEKSVDLLRDLWSGHLSTSPICCVIARLLCQLLLRQREGVGARQQEFLLSLVEHGEIDLAVPGTMTSTLAPPPLCVHRQHRGGGCFAQVLSGSRQAVLSPGTPSEHCLCLEDKVVCCHGDFILC